MGSARSRGPGVAVCQYLQGGYPQDRDRVFTVVPGGRNERQWVQIETTEVHTGHKENFLCSDDAKAGEQVAETGGVVSVHQGFQDPTE